MGDSDRCEALVDTANCSLLTTWTAGRAIDILASSLPSFFNSGLLSTGASLPLHLPHLHFPHLPDGIFNGKGKGKEKAQDNTDEDAEQGEGGIYARNVRLEYTPPHAMPAPFPRVLTVEGTCRAHTYFDERVTRNALQASRSTSPPPSSSVTRSTRCTPTRAQTCTSSSCTARRLPTAAAIPCSRRPGRSRGRTARRASSSACSSPASAGSGSA